MFCIDENGDEVQLTKTADYLAEAQKRYNDNDEDYADLAEEYTAKFAKTIAGLYDSAEDVGAVVIYYKGNKMVALFDYENYDGGVV
jgi:O-succinylbenzoate synthase